MEINEAYKHLLVVIQEKKNLLKLTQFDDFIISIYCQSTFKQAVLNLLYTVVSDAVCKYIGSY